MLPMGVEDDMSAAYIARRPILLLVLFSRFAPGLLFTTALFLPWSARFITYPGWTLRLLFTGDTFLRSVHLRNYYSTFSP